MQLLKLEVQNWVHHRKQTCEFTRGLVAILGENGSGKSSLFGAIRWALTGENPNFGVKADNISQYAKPGEPAYVSLEFEHNGHYASVTRHLLPEKEPSICIVDNEEVARGDKAVTSAVEKLLGVDAKFISRFIIVAQTEIFSFIDDSQSETDKFFQRLFSTSIADKCQDIIGKRLAKIVIPEVAKSSGQISIDLSAAKKDLQAVDDELSKYPSFDAYAALQKKENDTLLAWQLCLSAVQQVSETKQELLQQTADLELAQKDLESCVADLAVLDAATDGGEEAHKKAQQALGHWENYKKITALRDDLAQRRAELSARRLDQSCPSEPAVPEESVLLHKINENTLIKNYAEQFLSTFTSGVARCPLCNTPAADLQDEVARQQKLLDAAGTSLAELESELRLRQDYAAQKSMWQESMRRLDVQEEEISKSESALHFVPPPEETEEELKQTVADFEDFDAARAELQPVIESARERVSTLRGAIDSTKRRLERLALDVENCSVTEADADMAERKLSEIAAQLSARSGVEERRLALQHSVTVLAADFEAALAQEKTAETLRRQIEVAEAARAALKNAPRIVAQRNLKQLEHSINELLQIFNVNFSVSVANTESPSFVAEFYDGRKQVAQRLSIGQKTVLALAFRVAVNAQFAEEIGLLALDEPTASLDAPRIKALAPVLEKLRDLSTAKGLQCLLVTHAASLSHLFESTIELDPPELRHAAST